MSRGVLAADFASTVRVDELKNGFLLFLFCSFFGAVAVGGGVARVVKRELCQITTKGTRTFNVMEGDCGQADAHFLLALAEKVTLPLCLVFFAVLPIHS